jgi:hypothetical protein
MKEAYEKGYKNLLIFEDDIVINEDRWKEELPKCIEFMKNNKDWEIFFLGCAPIIYDPSFKTRQVVGNIYQTHALTTHAYVVSRDYMERLSKVPYIGVRIDKITSESKHSYGCLPSIVYQTGDFISDIQSTSYGMLKDLTTLTVETYAINVKTPLHVIIIILIVAVIILCVLYLVNPPYRYVWFFALVFLILFAIFMIELSLV